jgi:hypothetical protein
MREQQRHNVIELVELCHTEPVSQLAQHLDAVIVLLKSDAHSLTLQLFKLIASDAVHLDMGLAEKADRVVHEFGHRPRWPLRDCHQVSFNSMWPRPFAHLNPGVQ